MNPRLIVLCLSMAMYFAYIAQWPRANAQRSSEEKVSVIYTGKLLGYFRVPSLQKLEDFKGCYPTSSEDSSAARKFLAMRRTNPDAILVGTGDNFAPELEARKFSMRFARNQSYPISNKELYFGKDRSWIPYFEIQEEKNKDLRQRIADGYGTIPTDNVGCFLRAAHYAAVVPGKHDFYFGVERVRQFARLLAEPRTGEFEPVQMLGANIVIKTTRLNYSPGSSKIRGDMKFNEWPSNLAVANLSDGKAFYPSLPYIQVQLAEMKGNDDLFVHLNSTFQSPEASLPEFINAIAPYTATGKENQTELQTLKQNAAQSNSIRLCKTDKDPNLLDPGSGCDGFSNKVVTWKKKKIVLTLTLNHLPAPGPTRGHFSTLNYGLNYGLCVDRDLPPDPPNASTVGCLRFSAYKPFFNHPHSVSMENTDGYTDPLPYVIKDGVAIFGVVDPALTDQIGVLNLGWQNERSNLTSKVSFEDPVEALKQQLDYFAEQTKGQNIKLKILLVQGSPQRTRALAAKFSDDFQIVVSAADQEQGTSGAEMYTHWRPNRNAFLAVPNPYFNPSTKKQAIHFSWIAATSTAPKTSWKLTASNFDPVEVTAESDDADEFWKRVEARVGGNLNLKSFSGKTCTPAEFQRGDKEKNSRQDYLKWLVLCAMRDHTKADIALIQKRDLFDQIPKFEKSESNLLNPAGLPNTAADDDRNLQQTIDRLIWKGDLLSLLYVPGSALKSTLDKSEVFAAEENSSLSLAVDRGRSLEKLGVFKENSEYLVNGLPIDDKKIYAVATTDYIGAGDTGYPDLVKAALNPRVDPRAFKGNELVSISSLVCGLLTDSSQYCLKAIDSDSYLDETSTKEVQTYKSQNWFKRVLDTSGFSWPKENEEPSETSKAVEQKIQRRGIWSFSLKQLSLGIKDLDNNRTDKNVERTFGGIPTSGVNAKGSHTTTLFVDSRLSYSAYKNEFFIAGGIDFDKSSTGEPDFPSGQTELSKAVTLSKNRIFGDLGVILWRRPGRSAKTVGAVISLHGETQFQGPFSIYQLGTGPNDRIKIDQNRSLLLMGRIGARWQGKQNYFEIGGQAGRELRALKGYVFDTPGTPAECLVQFDRTLSKCISDNSTPPAGLVTMNTPSTVLLEGRPRAGIYWNHGFSIPFTPKLSYSVTQDADFFFIKFGRDTTIDTRFRYNSKTSLDFKVWPSLSFGPTLDLLLYQNKVNRDFLFQYNFGIGTKISFDLFNRRERGTQIKQQR